MSSGIGASSWSMPWATTIAATVGPLIEVSETFLQIECSSDSFQSQSQLHHSKSHLRLDAHNDRIRAAQANHVRDVEERACSKGIHDIKRGHIHHYATRAKPHRLFDERSTQLQ